MDTKLQTDAHACTHTHTHSLSHTLTLSHSLSHTHATIFSAFASQPICLVENTTQEGHSDGVVEKTQLLAKTDELAAAASAYFELQSVSNNHVQESRRSTNLLQLACSVSKRNNL